LLQNCYDNFKKSSRKEGRMHRSGGVFFCRLVGAGIAVGGSTTRSRAPAVTTLAPSSGNKVLEEEGRAITSSTRQQSSAACCHEGQHQQHNNSRHNQGMLEAPMKSPRAAVSTNGANFLVLMTRTTKMVDHPYLVRSSNQ
jgi:hypothetical protein